MNDNILRQAKITRQRLNEALTTHANLLDELSIGNFDEKDKELVNNLKNDISKSLNLAKKGDLNAINEIINRYGSSNYK